MSRHRLTGELQSSHVPLQLFPPSPGRCNQLLLVRLELVARLVNTVCQRSGTHENALMHRYTRNNVDKLLHMRESGQRQAPLASCAEGARQPSGQALRCEGSLRRPWSSSRQPSLPYRPVPLRASRLRLLVPIARCPTPPLTAEHCWVSRLPGTTHNEPILIPLQGFGSDIVREIAVS